MEIKQPHTRNVLRTGCAALENAEESLRSRSCKRLMARKLSFVHHRLFSAKAALVLPIPSFLEDRLFSAKAFFHQTHSCLECAQQLYLCRRRGRIKA